MSLSLDRDQLSFYKENGYILLSDIFTPPQIEECSKSYDELFKLKSGNSNLEATWGGNWKQSFSKNLEEQNMSVLSIHNLQCHDSIFTKMLLNDKLLDAVSQLIGSLNILLHHTKAHIKPPNIGAPFPTHQDYPYFPYKNHTMVAIFINLDESNPDNGGLAVFPGTHKLGPLENFSDSDKAFYVDQEKYSLDKGVPIHAKKGDVIIFSYFLVHGSYPNLSDRVRRMLLFQMMSADDEPTKNTHKSPCSGMVLRGKNTKQNADLDKRHEQK